MDLPQHVIELGDVTLRRFRREADLPELYRVIEEAREHLSPWMPWAVDHSRASTAAFLDKREEGWECGREFTYAVVLGAGIVGACQLFRREGGPDGGCEIGYWLHPAATGRGVATRAVRALVDQAARLPGVEYVEVVHEIANRASGAVAARAGFTRHGRRPADGPDPADTGGTQVWRLSLRPPGAPAPEAP
ncbi:GNAT family N-acetyltransferase [Kitasatospora sp. NPDC054939]